MIGIDHQKYRYMVCKEDIFEMDHQVAVSGKNKVQLQGIYGVHTLE